jgi:hypothetical protein
MRTSTAFEAIEDPNDPAWHGHAPDSVGDGRWGGRRRMLGVAAALVVVALLAGGVIAIAGRGSDGNDRDSTSDDAGASTVRPSAVVAADAISASPPELEPVAPVATAKTPTVAPASSGWAPAAATVSPAEAGSGLLTGDLTGIHPELIKRLDALAVAMGSEIEVVSGWRTRHEQEGLYQSFLSGVGNLAAVPGTSNHETGRAADVYVDGVSLADVDGARAQAAALGLHFPVAGEAWHVEMVGIGSQY